ncbi:MAG: hypothetical protein R2856_26665 [Caldilineaceae bacterium]
MLPETTTVTELGRRGPRSGDLPTVPADAVLRRPVAVTCGARTGAPSLPWTPCTIYAAHLGTLLN